MTFSLIISKLKKESCGKNCLPVKILILAKEYLLEPITLLINDSFRSGVFPNILKYAHITLIHKKKHDAYQITAQSAYYQR